MNNKIIIYHGSTNIIQSPTYGLGNPHNDYGPGFYCTESINLAKEWACDESLNGFANKYELNTEGLTYLNINDGKHHILNWLALLLENRTFRVDGDIMPKAKEYILKNFLIEYKDFDFIKGYRADDSYFSFATAFINNSLSLQQLEKSMLLGNLGEQIVIKSNNAFNHIKFLESEPSDRTIYYPLKLSRDQKARHNYQNQIKNQFIENGIYVMDILREKWRNDDERLQRVIYK